MSASIPPSTLEKFTTFGDLLRYLRRRQAVTQLELSVAVGYSDAQISRLEQNLRLPDIPTLQARFVPALGLEDEPQAVSRLLELAANVRREDAPALGLCPYKGLNYFDEADADLFVGREELTANLAERVMALSSPGPADEARFLAIVGASGSGKSSLVRAGLVPALRWNKASANWPFYTLTPTSHPLESLAAALTPDANSVAATARLMDDFLADPRSLHLFVRRILEPARASRLVLVIDQFEELFSLCHSETERMAFIDNLLTAAVEDDAPTIVVITLRADFYAHCAGHVLLREALAAQQEYIGAMSDVELQRAIEEPARRGRWDFEPGLVDVLLHDVGHEPGALPLLSHALLETWQRRRGRTMTLSGYASSGGVRGAIAETAESVFTDQFTHEQQIIARRVFLRLTELGEETATGDTRRRATFDELILKPEQAATTQAVLKALADARLITTSEDSAEVAHEALIREWPTLRGWLEDNREGLYFHRHLTEAAQEWVASGREQDMLYRGARLTQARDWASTHEGEMNAFEREFLTGSIEAGEREAAERDAQRQRELDAAQKLAESEKQRAQVERQRAEEQARTAGQLRGRARYLAGAFGIALLMAIIALFFGRQARQAAITAQANLTRSTAQRLAAEAQALLQAGSNSDLIALLSIRSMQTQYSAQGDGALIGAAALDYPRLVLAGDQGQISSVAYSPDGKYAATGGWGGTVILWDSQTGESIRSFNGHSGRILDTVFSPDGLYLLTASDDGTARLWDVATGEELRWFAGNGDPLLSVAFSPDGRYALAGGEDQTARLWDLDEPGQEPREFIGHTDSILSVEFSPDGDQVLTYGNDGTVRLWDAATGGELRQFPGYTGHVGNAVLSPDGRSILIAGGFAPIARLLDAETGQEIQTLTGSQSGVGSVAFSPDGRYALTGSDDKTARLWDVETGQELRRFSAHDSMVRSLAFSPDGTSLLTGSYDGAARVWDLQTKPELPRFTGHTDAVTAVAFSPDGERVLTGGMDKTARLWDARDGRELRAFMGHADGLNYGAAFSPDGKNVATGSWDGTARLWDAKTGSELQRFLGHTAGVNRVAFSPDGRTLLSASNDTTARLWNLEDGAELCQFVGHTGPVSTAAFSPDGKYALTSSDDHTARLWDILTCKEIRVFKPHFDSVYGVAFSPDGEYIATGSLDGMARLWETGTGQQVRDFVGHPGFIWSVAFSPDGKLLATVGDDQTARLWDVQAGREVRRFAYSAGLADVAFSPNGEYLLTGSFDGTARLWAIDYQDTIRFLCERVSRDFTDDEQVQYDIADASPTCPMD